MAAHTGRCFRAFRRTKQRLEKQGREWAWPIRQKVPQALQQFVGHIGRRTTPDIMRGAILRHVAHVNKIKGHGAARGR